MIDYIVHYICNVNLCMANIIYDKMYIVVYKVIVTGTCAMLTSLSSLLLFDVR